MTAGRLKPLNLTGGVVQPIPQNIAGFFRSNHAVGIAAHVSTRRAAHTALQGGVSTIKKILMKGIWKFADNKLVLSQKSRWQRDEG